MPLLDYTWEHVFLKDKLDKLKWKWRITRLDLEKEDMETFYLKQ